MSIGSLAKDPFVKDELISFLFYAFDLFLVMRELSLGKYLMSGSI